MLNIILLLVGFVALIKGADIFVDASSSIAKKFNIPSIIIGMTIVAMGTSLPELSVSVTSSLAGLNDMSIANVTGSNIFNLLIALGVCSTIGKLKISNYKDVITLLFSCIGLLLFALNGTLGVFEGILLLVVFTIYILSMMKQAKDNKEESEDEKQRSIFITVVLGILGAIAIVIGGNMVVNSASEIALNLGMSENLVGLTIVALGTSLPEFVTSVIATKKGETEIAIGNVIGSNIFNVLLILGTASSIKPLTVSTVALFDIFFMVFTVIMFVCLTKKEKVLTKNKGSLMMMTYVVYLVFTIIR